MTPTDDAALVAELKRYREREPDARSFVVAREEYDRLLALADEALSLRRVRDAAAEYSNVERIFGQLNGLAANALKQLRATLDADAARGKR